MAYRIPRTVRVNGRVYRVMRVSDSAMPKDDGPLWGFCDSEKTEILLARALSGEAARGTYEHEVGHAAAEESGARALMKKYTSEDEELEENLCRIWLPVYLEALRDKVR